MGQSFPWRSSFANSSHRLVTRITDMLFLSVINTRPTCVVPAVTGPQASAGRPSETRRRAKFICGGEYMLRRDFFFILVGAVVMLLGGALFLNFFLDEAIWAECIVVSL